MIVLVNLPNFYISPSLKRKKNLIIYWIWHQFCKKTGISHVGDLWSQMPSCGTSPMSDPHRFGQSRPLCSLSFLTSIVFILHLAGKLAAFCLPSENPIGLVLAPGERALIPFSILRSDAVGFSLLHHLLPLASSPSPSISVSGLFSANHSPSQMFATNQEHWLRPLPDEVWVGFFTPSSWPPQERTPVKSQTIISNLKRLTQITLWTYSMKAGYSQPWFSACLTQIPHRSQRFSARRMHISVLFSVRRPEKNSQTQKRSRTLVGVFAGPWALF